MKKNKQTEQEIKSFTEIKIEQQGSPVLSETKAIIIKRSNDFVAFTIDLKSKYCEVAGTFGDYPEKTIGLHISANEESLNLNLNFEGLETIISFPEFVGWDVFSTSNGRYNINVCLIKENK